MSAFGGHAACSARVASSRFRSGRAVRPIVLPLAHDGRFPALQCDGEDRHPTVFRTIRDLLGAENPCRILTFGCSTGEEAFTLRRYFPRAEIKGIDINPYNIAKAGQRLARAPDARISFATASSTEREAAEYYDAILCLSVLRHGALGDTQIMRSDSHIRFEDFSRTVADFARCVRLGGLLVIRHSNFRFCDAPTYGQFEPVACKALTRSRYKAPIFGPDNRRLHGVVYDEVIFRKKS